MANKPTHLLTSFCAAVALAAPASFVYVAINPGVKAKLPYDTLKDLTSISQSSLVVKAGGITIE